MRLRDKSSRAPWILLIALALITMAAPRPADACECGTSCCGYWFQSIMSCATYIDDCSCMFIQVCGGGPGNPNPRHPTP